MYKFEHRAMKKIAGLRIRTPDQVMELVSSIRRNMSENRPELMSQSMGMLNTLITEAAWLRSPWMLYLSNPMQDALIKIGQDAGTYFIHPDLPKIGVVGDYLYDIDDSFFVYSKQESAGIYHRRLDLADLPKDDACLNLVVGLSIYMRSFPDALRDGPPSTKVKPLNKRQKSQHLVGHRPSSDIGVSFVRRPHFRVLGHSRFKRNDDGTPRVVLVKEAEVKLTSKQESSHLD